MHEKDSIIIFMTKLHKTSNNWLDIIYNCVQKSSFLLKMSHFQGIHFSRTICQMESTILFTSKLELREFKNFSSF